MQPRQLQRILLLTERDRERGREGAGEGEGARVIACRDEAAITVWALKKHTRL